MTNHFCTITTKSHLGKTFALCHSIIEISKETLLYVLITDEKKQNISLPDRLKGYIIFFDAGDIESDEYYALSIERYSGYPDKLRWTFKPVFLRWLLLQNKFGSKIIYTDNDIYFADDYRFLFDMLDLHNFLLTPHWRADNPFVHPWWFETNFRDGIYNAGFIGVNQNAIKALEWWASACLYRCQKSYIKGFFDDQKYLDLMPVIEPKTAVIHHKGCNVACWNNIKLKREVKDNAIIIDGNYPLIFIHFADCTIAAINSGIDKVLMNLLLHYENILKQYNFNLNIDNITRKEKFWGHYRHIKWLITGGLFVLLSSYYNRIKLHLNSK